MSTTPKLADWIDPSRLSAPFKAHGRLHLPDFFEAGFADRLTRTLEGEMPWSRSVMFNGVGYDASLESLANAPAEKRREIDAALAVQARQGFQYDFETWRVSDHIEAGAARAGALAPVEAVYDFLNGPAFLGLIRKMTGDQRPAYCDAQVTRYRAGHFLNTHDDALAGKDRLYAYVINLTRDWRTDWGGLLLFQDADGHVSEGYAPRYNALNVFRVPHPHSVTQVASFVTASRLSITGWVRGASAKPKGL